MCHVPAVLWRRISLSVSFTFPFCCLSHQLLSRVKIPLMLCSLICPHANIFSYITLISPDPLLSLPSHQVYSPICLPVSRWQWAKHRPACLHHNNQWRGLHLMGQRASKNHCCSPRSLWVLASCLRAQRWRFGEEGIGRKESEVEFPGRSRNITVWCLTSLKYPLALWTCSPKSR